MADQADVETGKIASVDGSTLYEEEDAMSEWSDITTPEDARR
jgi:hypothetical protein